MSKCLWGIAPPLRMDINTYRCHNPAVGLANKCHWNWMRPLAIYISPKNYISPDMLLHHICDCSCTEKIHRPQEIVQRKLGSTTASCIRQSDRFFFFFVETCVYTDSSEIISSAPEIAIYIKFICMPARQKDKQIFTDPAYKFLLSLTVISDVTGL